MICKTILFIIDGLSGGGAEKIVLTLAEAMVKKGHEVIIASLGREKAYPLPQGVRYFLIEDTYRGPLWRQTEIQRRARLLDQALLENIGEQKIDLAVSHLPKTDRIVVASEKLRDAWLCLHCALTAGELKNKSGLRRFFKRRQLVKTYSGRKIITVSRALQEDVLAVGIRPARMTTIYNPINLSNVRAQACAQSPFEGERFLLHVGRFNSQKRHDRLLEAFKMSGYQGKLILLGQGTEEEKASLEEQAKNLEISHQLVIHGFIENPYLTMRAAEALLLSSDYEGLPNVLVEALACGTQVISTNCPYGPAEILQGPLAQGLCALTPSALAETIRHVLSHPVAITEEMLEPFTLQQSVQ